MLSKAEFNGFLLSARIADIIIPQQPALYALHTFLTSDFRAPPVEIAGVNFWRISGQLLQSLPSVQILGDVWPDSGALRAPTWMGRSLKIITHNFAVSVTLDGTSRPQTLPPVAILANVNGHTIKYLMPPTSKARIHVPANGSALILASETFIPQRHTHNGDLRDISVLFSVSPLLNPDPGGMLISPGRRVVRRLMRCHRPWPGYQAPTNPPSRRARPSRSRMARAHRTPSGRACRARAGPVT